MIKRHASVRRKCTRLATIRVISKASKTVIGDLVDPAANAASARYISSISANILLRMFISERSTLYYCLIRSSRVSSSLERVLSFCTTAVLAVHLISVRKFSRFSFSFSIVRLLSRNRWSRIFLWERERERGDLRNRGFPTDLALRVFDLRIETSREFPDSRIGGSAPWTGSLRIVEFADSTIGDGWRIRVFEWTVRES